MRQLAFFVLSLWFFWTANLAEGQSVLIEAENFTNRGGWVVDQQFMDLMGSPYLMAHGMGVPVDDAATVVNFPAFGIYRVFVRTFNWTSPWHHGEGPGRFQLLVNGLPVGVALGTTGNRWMWQDAGTVTITSPSALVALHDLTGFNGRCDAIFFTKDDVVPPDDLAMLRDFRVKYGTLPEKPDDAGEFDFVVVGGGIAGTCAAISAARLGLRVALIQDRPVLGGNNSSEVRVHLGGRINIDPYPALGNVVREIGPSQGGNARPAGNYEDHKIMGVVLSEENISLFLNYRAYALEMEGSKISRVLARNIKTGKELSFSATIFADCTGDGTIGYLAGADYSIGREGRDEFGEETAPETGDKMTMGSSVQWYSAESETKNNTFPQFNYGIVFNELNAQKVTMGEWTWETGMNFHQVYDFERIRDYGLMVVFSNWSYLKNHSSVEEDYRDRRLEWVAYIAGKRESRRLLGDHILTENDIRDHVLYDDASVTTTWSIDLHYPDPENTKHFPGQEFKSIAEFIHIHQYPIPYRCFYSRNVDNLFMAGRNISVTHVALGTVRVMRTTGMMGEVVGMAASLCRKHQTTPRGIYRDHLDELKSLMEAGVGRYDIEGQQNYNQGSTLGPWRE
jgi:hypothetical protein